jgi:quercetin dioxygenase-like cupin family protein
MTEARRYFALDPAGGTPIEPGAFLDIESELPVVEFVAGLVFRPVIGQRVMVNFVRYEPDTEAPVHAHEEEQVTFVVSGEFEFDLDGEVRVMRPGMAVWVPPWVPHGARTRDTTCQEIDVFAPPRAVLVEAVRASTGQEG